MFREKVARICDLYRNPPADAVVLCIDEKPLQTLEPVPNAVGPDGVVRRDFSTCDMASDTARGAGRRDREVTTEVVDKRDADPTRFMQAGGGTLSGQARDRRVGQPEHPSRGQG
ncbi:MAG: hypothetical protein IPG17_33440 [Sandaracinaceae bacterium]|nr:hypothetical protein [Sandaracinaceae bacterium]